MTMRPITTDHLRRTYGLGENNNARQVLTFLKHIAETDAGDGLVMTFGKRVATIRGIHAYEEGTGDLRGTCSTCRTHPCFHALSGLWHRALARENTTVEAWWEAEKKRRTDPVEIAREQAEAERRLEESREAGRREIARREAERVLAQQMREIDEIVDAPAVETRVGFRFDPEGPTLEPLVDGRRIPREPNYSGGYGYGRTGYPRYAHDDIRIDMELLYRNDRDEDVTAIRTMLDGAQSRGKPGTLTGKLGRLTLEAAVDAGLAVLADGRRIVRGEAHQGEVLWEVKKDGTQQCHLQIARFEEVTTFQLDCYMLIDRDAVLRRIDTGLREGVFEKMAAMGRVAPEMATMIHEQWSTRLPENCIPRPIRVEKRRGVPRAVVTLDQHEVGGRVVQDAKIAMEYEWGIARPQDGKAPESTLEGDVFVVHERDAVAEAQLMDRLKGAGESYRSIDDDETVLRFDGDETLSVRFKKDILPGLERHEGWTVRRSPRWNSDLIEWSSGSSFELELADLLEETLSISIKADVQGVRSDVMEALVDIAAQIPIDADDDAVDQMLERIIDPEGHPLRQETGGVLLVPAAVMRPVIRSLWRFIHDAEMRKGDAFVSKMSLADLVDLGADVRLRSDTMIGRLVDMFRGLKDAPPTPLPTTFNAAKHSIDPAQQQGLDWMQALYRAGFGGVLADEVGVGKTVQILLQAASLLDQGKLTEQALIVVPKTAVRNWSDQAEEFFPGLKVLVWRGGGRHKSTPLLRQAHVVITTYGCVTSDQAINGRHWSFVAMDEAQDVRTPSTQNAQSLMALKADQKVPTTGTPLENSLIDVWTIMNIANPGLLGPLGHFRTNVQKPVENLGDSDVQRRLARFLLPFMLHRTRKEAGHNVPDPIIEDVPIVVSEAQARLYEFERLTAKSEISAIISAKGFARSKGEILGVLMRLRQICCHPRLVNKQYAREMGADDSSAKTDEALSTALRLKAQRKRILVFSQWVGHLDLLQERFEAEGLVCGRIDGSLSSAKREAAETEFKAGATDVLFITMGTGGKSLNIPEADAVFIMDPWWNPQKEIQGIGRTQRRGQKKVVLVYRFIVESSIETRVVKIQKRKLKLADSIFEFRSPEQQIVFTEEELWDMLSPIGKGMKRAA